MLQCGMNLRVNNELSHNGKKTMVRRFKHEGLGQLQNRFVTDEDLRGRKVLPLSPYCYVSLLTLKFNVLMV